MSRKSTFINIDYLVHEHFTKHRNIADLASELNIGWKTIEKRLQDAGYVPWKRYSVDSSIIIKQFSNGKSVNEISKKFKIARNTINRILLRNNIRPRTQSEAETLKWSNMTEYQRKKQVQKAHEARRDQTDSIETKLKRSNTNYKKNNHVYPREVLFFNMLIERGFNPICQFSINGPWQSIGQFNAQLTLDHFCTDNIAVDQKVQKRI